jgi:hypothetical protein
LVEKILLRDSAGHLHKTPLEQTRQKDQQLFTMHGSSEEVSFAARYGFGDRTISALNYHEVDLVHLDSAFPLRIRPTFSLGSFIFDVSHHSESISITCDDSYRIGGTGLIKSPKGEKRYFSIFDLRVISSRFSDILGDLSLDSTIDELRPCEMPPTWIDRLSGRILTCRCFEDFVYPNKKGFDGYFPYLAESQLPRLEICEGLCAICSDHVPPPEAGHAMYYNNFLRRYSPYQQLYFSKMFKGIDLSLEELPEAQRKSENAAREAVGYPKIGEQWPSETLLYRLVSQLLPDSEVIHHHKPVFLEGLEFDIYIPDVRLAIEYQGIQHYEPINRFGGISGHEKLKERDARKRILAKNNDIRLHEWHYETPISEESVKALLAEYRCLTSRDMTTTTSRPV